MQGFRVRFKIAVNDAILIKYRIFLESSILCVASFSRYLL